MVEEPTNRPDPSRYLVISQVGLEMVAPIVLGVFLDHWLDTTPWLTIVGAVVGLAGGLYHLLTIVNAPKDRAGDAENNPP
jgi:F0F1-type ATP synthase assembly protein I